MRELLISLLFFVAASARAAIQIPTQLTHSDREQTLRVIGLGTGTKLLSDPYPLGGYSGFEVGLSYEDLPTDSLAQLGSKLSSPQEDIAYPKLTVGKGVYNNIDLFVQFTPYQKNDQLTQFGALVRWGFLQGQLFPYSAAILLHANDLNSSNVLTTRTYGLDLTAGVSVGAVSVSGGVGYLQSNGTFTGGSAGVTAESTEQDETVGGLRTFVGANIRLFEKGFIAVELDRTDVPVFSGKVGARF